MATFVEAAGAKHPDTYQGLPIQPLEGKSLLPIFEGKIRPNSAPIFWEHEGNRAVRLRQWKLVARHGQAWELYDVDADRTELNNLAADYPERVKEMSALYEVWAKRCNVLPPEQLPRERPILPAAAKESPRRPGE
jgi:arylsulfatase